MNRMRDALDRLAETSDEVRRAAFEVVSAVPASATRPDFNISSVLEAKATLRAAIGALDTALEYNEGQKL